MLLSRNEQFMEDTFDTKKQDYGQHEVIIEEDMDEDSQQKKKLRGTKTWIPTTKYISGRSRWRNLRKFQERSGLQNTNDIKIVTICQQQLKKAQVWKQLTSWIYARPI